MFCGMAPATVGLNLMGRRGRGQPFLRPYRGPSLFPQAAPSTSAPRSSWPMCSTGRCDCLCLMRRLPRTGFVAVAVAASMLNISHFSLVANPCFAQPLSLPPLFPQHSVLPHVLIMPSPSSPRTPSCQLEEFTCVVCGNVGTQLESFAQQARPYR